MLTRILHEGLPGCRRAARQIKLRWRYQRGVEQRQSGRSSELNSPIPERIAGEPTAEIVEQLWRDGCAVLPGVFDPAGLEEVRRELDRGLADQRTLPVLRGHIQPGEERFLSSDEIARGDEYMRPRVPIVYLSEPFVTCPSSLRYIFSEEIVGLARAVHGCPAALTAGKVMRSYANDLPPLEFNQFHYDTQAHRILKFFLYLHDVGPGGGALCYVAGSHRAKPLGAFTRGHLSDGEIEEHYGAGAMRELTARCGSLVIADTRGFHRAAKPRNADRSVLLITTGVHAFPGPVQLPRAEVERLPVHLRSMADLAELR